jgi:aminoglycoside phosphotransferase (APT) family kinase protein
MAVTADQIHAGLQRRYDTGAAEPAGARVAECTLLASGFEADVFAFTVCDRSADDPADRLVLRLYAGDGASEKAAREFDALRRLAQVGYPVPRVRVLEADGSTFGRPFLIMDRIDGESLESVYRNAPPERRLELQSLHAGLLARLHALDPSVVLPDSALAGPQDPHAFVDHELRLLTGWADRLDDQAPPSLRRALAWLAARRAQASCDRLSVIHGDFHRNNALMGAAHPVVIDWSNVRIADPRMDLAWTWLIASLCEPGIVTRPEPRLYEAATGRPVPAFEFFQAAACLRLVLSVQLSILFGTASQGMRPETEARMRSEAESTRQVAAHLQTITGIGLADYDDALTALLAAEPPPRVV